MAKGARSSIGLMRGSRPRQAVLLLAGALALVVQLLFAPPHMAMATPAAESAAELAALTGHADVLCLTGDDQHQGAPVGAPVHGDADCPGLCCQLGHGHAVFLPPPAPSVVVVARSFEIRLPQPPAPQRPEVAHSAKARGPPQTA